jgi:hypothetical protein
VSIESLAFSGGSAESSRLAPEPVSTLWDQELSPGEAVSFEVVFSYALGVNFTYDVRVTGVESATGDAQNVPEPGRVWTLLAGWLLLQWVARRRSCPSERA